MKTLLFNPFERFAGLQSVIIGLCILALTSFIASLGSVHFDGAIDLHIDSRLSAYGKTTFVSSLAETIIDLFSVVLFMYITGLFLSKSSIRVVDVIGTQAMARFPFLIACISALIFPTAKMDQFIEYKFLHQGQPVDLSITDYLAFGISSLIMLTMIVWMLVLMYRSYSVSCNVKGTKAVVSFIIALILAEIVSKVLVGVLLY
jgi:hypothetical protein